MALPKVVLAQQNLFATIVTAVIDFGHYYFNIFSREEHYNTRKFICSGRKVPRTGGIILCNCMTKQEAEQIAKQDPFFKEKIAQYEIVEFEPSKSLDSFKHTLEETK